MVSASGSGNSVGHAHDRRGWRMSKTVNSTATIYVTDAHNPELLEYSASNDRILRHYVYGNAIEEALNQIERSGAICIQRHVHLALTRRDTSSAYFDGGSARVRMRPGSITENRPAQSCRLSMIRDSVRPAAAAAGIGSRKSTTPHSSGSRRRKASSPKSLSKVKSTRRSPAARASTSSSELPGASVRIQATSWPALRSAATASPGTFSSARKRTPHSRSTGRG
jgi:hypothetical protein